MREKEELERLIDSMDNIPSDVPYYFVLYAYMLSALRRTGNNKTKTSKAIHMSIRAFRVNLIAAKVYGFFVPDALVYNPFTDVLRKKRSR